MPMWYSVKVKRVSSGCFCDAANGDCAIPAMKHVSITVSLATLLSVLPVIGSGFGFQGTPEKPEPYAVTLPNSVVKIDMVPVPEGTVEIEGKPVKVKPFYMAATETTWEAFDVFLASGPPSKPYDQTQFAAD